MTRKKKQPDPTRGQWQTGVPDYDRLDQVQALIFLRLEQALHELWPSRATPPAALWLVHEAAFDLVYYSVCSERGRGQMRKRMLERWQPGAEATSLGHDNNLATNPTAIAVVPGLLSHILGQTSDLDPDGFGDAVETWLLEAVDGEGGEQ